MIIGRNVALWLGLGTAVISFVACFWVVTGGTVDAALVAAINGLWAAIVAVVANVNTPGALPTFSLRTKPDGSPSRDLR